MKEVGSFEQWLDIMTMEPQLLLFVKTDHCSVCDGLYPQVAELEDDYSFPFYKVNVAQVPEMAGQLSLFTAPVILLFHQEKETARFARFVPMEELKHRMAELVEWGKGDA
ncbi:thioredoxin family protein [Sporosarcina thermotolerans]|uniref:Thioredoxin family protein n=1 Tax=Sporosarcina thermotolerans TaxID=633404 RepID=A0AAW9A8K4_9BACL|nr:thioredoxin family protein [Sporosarcina thermotolerans]MDW0115496.1 thioredoxin family protein [Sporosarcina thermotolerans]WHT47178.1 thioredoxin family protein [Sporosarcina thermotolerans]